MERDMVPVSSDVDELNDREWLHDQITSGKGVAAIADELGVAKNTVRNHIVRHDLNDGFAINETAACDKLNDTDWLQAQLNDGKRAPEIAQMCGTSKRNVNTWIVRHDLQRPSEESPSRSLDLEPDGAWAKPNQPWRDEDRLREAYWEYYWSPPQLAQFCGEGVSEKMIYRAMKNHGIQMRDQRESSTVSQRQRDGADIETIREEVPPPWERGTDEGETDDSVTWGDVTA